MSTDQYYETKDATYYAVVRHDVIGMIPPGTRRVLDVGCGNGATSAVAKRTLGLELAVGVEPFESSAALAAEHLDHVIVGDIEEMEGLGYPDGTFDCIICADVLEHLRDPWAVLRSLARYLAPGGALLVSLPNLGHIRPIIKILTDRFEYEEHGILDRTHLRFFTRHTMIKMLNECGYRVERVEANRSRSLLFTVGMILSLGLLARYNAYQYRFVCRRT